jgi:hypothetical protein
MERCQRVWRRIVRFFPPVQTLTGWTSTRQQVALAGIKSSIAHLNGTKPLF